MVVSLVGNIAIVEVLRRGRLEGVSTPIDSVRYAFLAASIALALGVGVVRRLLVQGRSGEDASTLLLKLQRSTIVTAALSEIPAILGLVLFLIGGSRMDFYTLLAVSVGMLVAYFPRFSQWKNAVARLQRLRS
jgi:hypothetical protein